MMQRIQTNWLILLNVSLGAWLSGIVLAPMLALTGNYYLTIISNSLYFFFQPVCHQIAERSFQIADFAFCVCIRCFSFYLAGYLLSIYYLFKKKVKFWNLLIYYISIVIVLLDFLMEKCGLYQDLYLIRFITGGMLGLVVFHLLIISLSVSKPSITADEVRSGFESAK